MTLIGEEHQKVLTLGPLQFRIACLTDLAD